MDQDRLRQAAEPLLREWQGVRPSCAMILGSGWGDAAPACKVLRTIDYQSIPCLGSPRVTGHPGRLLLGEFSGIQVLLFLGRRHWYEGDGWEPVAFPVYLAACLKVANLVVTNASGGIRDDLVPGSIMILDDHINAMGNNPLIGPHSPCWGPRFPDQSGVYDAGLRRLLADAVLRAGQQVVRGIYLAVSGPAYETPAEVRAFRVMGADAVGMSTVPEALLGRAAGLRVAGLSCIANRAARCDAAPLSHDDVVATSRASQPRMRRVLEGFLELLAARPASSP